MKDKVSAFFSGVLAHPKILSSALAVFVVFCFTAGPCRPFLDRQLEQLSQSLTAAILPSTLLVLTNTDRAANGLSKLSENRLLDQAAQKKADDMAKRGYFAHVTPEGNTPLYFLNQVGYHYKNAGENLGVNYEDAAAIEYGWMNSPGHRANILLPQFTEIGFGISYGTYQGLPATFAVEIFATPQSSAAVKTAPAPARKTLAATSPTAALMAYATSTSKNATRILQIQHDLTSLETEIDRLTNELKQLQ